MTQQSYCNLNPNILRPHRIVRKQYQTPFQIFKSHNGRVLIIPSSLFNSEDGNKWKNFKIILFRRLIDDHCTPH